MQLDPRRHAPPRPGVVHGLRLCAPELTLRGLDPDLHYVVDHAGDGSVALRPLTSARYVARPDYDGSLTLRHPLEARWGLADVRRDDDGAVEITPLAVPPPDDVQIAWASTKAEFRTVRFGDGTSSMRRRQVFDINVTEKHHG